MSEKGYYIPAGGGGLATVGEFCECRKCGRKIIVEMGLIGTQHHVGTGVTCADCLEINDKFKQEFPEIAQRIENWKAGKELGPQYVFQTNEEVSSNYLYLEHTSRAGTITGQVITSEVIQNFSVSIDGKMSFTEVGKPDNYIVSGTYEDWTFNLKWHKETPKFILKVNYEYEV